MGRRDELRRYLRDLEAAAGRHVADRMALFWAALSGVVPVDVLPADMQAVVRPLYQRTPREQVPDPVRQWVGHNAPALEPPHPEDN